ncbi:triose-phosphate isomerase [Actinomycetospora sp. NBRC 106378]|uniref:triose-phosphate isomerase n=1 Tax=Actinomycetospora sp. NBRC 106378 TaxID=3032208 RepID=UPI0024A5F19E|nr:triose-phosphate isomerase [Actinomycetospora sp. NBRC 106378]GLZ52298.1 triosephosphate isomerase [Actinomycetospora sp. NBRC 106378]
MARTPLIAGNWKMNLNHLEAIGVVQKLYFALPTKYYDHVDVAVCPPFTDLRSVQTVIDADSMPITYGGQDCSPEESGAFTGDVSAAMLAKLGCTWVVLGHSERRTIHGEDDALVARKVGKALEHGLTPILCLGEGEDVREAGDHVSHCTAQLDGSLKGLSSEQAGRVVIAYEPVWAIGTGKTATAQDAQEVCRALRARLREQHGGAVADAVRILYGGSVKSGNVKEIVGQPDVDGALVGGASLDPEGFAELCALAAGGPL